MSLARHHIASVEQAEITCAYPRTVGRNARLGNHGDGGKDAITVIRTDSGRTGWGLTAGRVVDPETVIGRPMDELIDPASGVLDPALQSLDFALHDLAGVLLDLPVYALLGRAGESAVTTYDGAIYFDDLDPEDEPRGIGAVLDNCAADDAAGHRAFKIKIGRGNRWMDTEAGDQRDIQVVRAVREAYPEHRLLVDANDGYSLDRMIAFLDVVADCDLYWVEEPFGDDPEWLAALRKHLDAQGSPTLIADGETDPDLDALLPVAATGDINVLLMDVVGFGLTPWRTVMPQLVEMGAKASPHAWGRPLKTLYAAQMAAGMGNIDVVEGVPGETHGVDSSAYTFAAGVITVPDRPGFGLELRG